MDPEKLSSLLMCTPECEWQRWEFNPVLSDAKICAHSNYMVSTRKARPCLFVSAMSLITSHGRCPSLNHLLQLTW